MINIHMIGKKIPGGVQEGNIRSRYPRVDPFSRSSFLSVDDYQVDSRVETEDWRKTSNRQPREVAVHDIWSLEYPHPIGTNML
mmetsp:Transcript_23913/g.34296  ORF Transcript_23913/g.34296 Transcript_23913/m.34296 type:complete len:83 (-) Transcript_23913:143-391(-)